MSSNKIAVHRGSGNVFADLGFDNPDEMQLRADLVHELREIIKRRRLTQVAAAKLLGIAQPDLSVLLRGRLTKYSLERLLRLCPSSTAMCKSRSNRNHEIGRRVSRWPLGEQHCHCLWVLHPPP